MTMTMMNQYDMVVVLERDQRNEAGKEEDEDKKRDEGRKE